MSNSIAQAFKKLNVTSTSEDHENIFEVSYQYLSNVKNFNDVKSFNNCLVALINQDKYGKALEIINKVKNEDLIQQFSIEVGYVYYKTQQSKALHKLYQIINSKGSSKFLIRGLKHIVAQDFYQKGDYNQALELYHELILENEDIDNLLDLFTNELAIISQLNFSNNKLMSPKSSTKEENHDLVFNQALISLSNNETGLALSQLDKALKLLEYLGLDDESYQLERCPIILVKSYIYQNQGNKTKSLELLQDLKLKEFNDLLLNLIIKNNYYSVNETLNENDSNVNFFHKKLDYQEKFNSISSKLNREQFNTLIKNNLMLKFLTNTLSSHANQLSNTNLESFINKGDFSLLSYKILIKLGITNQDLISNPKAVGKKIFRIINHTEITNDNFTELVGHALILLYVNYSCQTLNQSLSALEKLSEFSLSKNKVLPGLTGSLINLYETVDLNEKLTNLYNRLIELLQSSSDISYNEYNFFKVLGFKLLIIDDPRYKAVFEKLYDINNDDGIIKNVLNSTNDGLLPVDTLVGNIDDDIVNTNIESLIPITKASKTTNVVQKIEKKRSKKPKFGANKVLKPVDQLNLDAERWLPLTLRSNYKPKKSKKKVATHQGAVESPTSSKASTPVPVSTPAPSSNTSSSKKANKKKKKGKK